VRSTRNPETKQDKLIRYPRIFGPIARTAAERSYRKSLEMNRNLRVKKKPESGTKKEINLLELIPRRNIGWEKDEEGLIVLLKPKLAHPFFHKHILSRLKRPYYRVKLDEIGSFFWDSCDGMRTVKDIAGRMKHHFGDKVDPVYERLTLFLQNLEKNKFIRLKGT